MVLGWFSRKRKPIDDDSWRATLAEMPFLAHLDTAALVRLRELCEDFLQRKTFTGVAGQEISEPLRVAIAAQACLPALNLGLGAYDDFVEIVVYPDQFAAARTRIDDAGVVHEGVEELAGEAMDGGPVVLSWADAAPGAGNTNVTIHEFVHKMDLADGAADGVPPLPRGRRAHWEATMLAAYDAFCRTLDSVEDSIPPDIDPESEAADPWYARLPLDPYAATDPAEFFAVSGEAFFIAPGPLADAFPDWYAELAAFFRQDPLAADQPRPMP